MLSKVRIDYIKIIPSYYARFKIFMEELKQALKDGELEGTNKHITRHYQDIHIIASCGICNTASLNIYGMIEFDIDDYVIAGINNFKPHKYKLYNTIKGVYFNYGGSRYYLNEFMRIRRAV
jgi:hypothetical protein